MQFNLSVLSFVFQLWQLAIKLLFSITARSLSSMARDETVHWTENAFASRLKGPRYLKTQYRSSRSDHRGNLNKRTEENNTLLRASCSNNKQKIRKLLACLQQRESPGVAQNRNKQRRTRAGGETFNNTKCFSQPGVPGNFRHSRNVGK